MAEQQTARQGRRSPPPSEERVQSSIHCGAGRMAFGLMPRMILCRRAAVGQPRVCTSNPFMIAPRFLSLLLIASILGACANAAAPNAITTENAKPGTKDWLLTKVDT